MNSKLVLYHGSTEIIEKPIFGFGKKDNDCGLGFYCTEDPEMSKEWACRYGTEGYSNKYLIDIAGLDVLDLNDKDHTLLQWAAVLVSNRRFSDLSPVGLASRKFLLDNCLPDIGQYDMVKGYRADDSYFVYTSDFLNGSIPYRIFSSAMRLGKLGEQIVLKSEESFKKIIFTGYEKVDQSSLATRYEERERRANESYLEMRSQWQYGSEDILMPDIINGRVRLDDPRLQ